MRMADRLAGGQLHSFMAEARANGESYDRIASLLWEQFGIEVTRTTVNNWCRMLGIEDAEAAS
jgi:intein-encoded DNA endonuclease-like protein